MRIAKKKRESGQSLVEFALMLPILLLLLCGIIDFGWVFGNQLIIDYSARDGARYGAINASNTSCATMVDTRIRANTPVAHVSDPNILKITTTTIAPNVSVEIFYKVPLLTPITSTFIGSTITVHSKCIMKAE